MARCRHCSPRLPCSRCSGWCFPPFTGWMIRDHSAHCGRGEAKRTGRADLMTFDYGSFTGRNLGFIDESEQQLLRDASVFVCGVGGMGGAAFMALARAGVGKFVIADIDRFEVSNLNRQVFAFNDEVGRQKADVAAEAAPRPEERLGFPTLRKHW